MSDTAKLREAFAVYERREESLQTVVMLTGDGMTHRLAKQLELARQDRERALLELAAEVRAFLASSAG